MKIGSMISAMVAAIAISLSTATAASWSEALCSAATKSPLCAAFQSNEGTTSDRTIAQLKALYIEKLDNWSANPDRTTIQDQVVQTCGMLTIINEPPEVAGRFMRGEERDEFDSRVDACTKITVHRAWPQPEFEKPQIVDLVCTRWTSLLRELCIRAKLKA